MKSIVPNYLQWIKMLNELLSVTPPKVRKKAIFMVIYIYVYIKRTIHGFPIIWIINH